MEASNLELIEIDIENIYLSPYQPRRNFSQEELKELADSIKAVGIIHPPTVRPTPGDPTKYELIAGERRFRAASFAGLTKIAVVVRRRPCEESAHASLIENIQRVDLNPVEIAKALQNLMRECGWHQEELAEQIGKKRSTVANYLRLLTLPRIIQEGLMTDKISMGHAKAILSLKGYDRQLALYHEVIRHDLSVREAERLAQKIDIPKKYPKSSTSKNCFLDHLQEKMQHKLGTKVTIVGQGTKGQIHIDYHNLDDLDRILAIIGVSQESFN